jgi:hypothetical protein
MGRRDGATLGQPGGGRIGQGRVQPRPRRGRASTRRRLGNRTAGGCGYCHTND